MDENLKILFGLLGGLAMFLYGMNSMSDALQKAAGEKMKKILGFLTQNPLFGVLAGALITAVLQSSSATTVMVIGFVSAGLMSLPQAISVIFGANIGTTMTAQLMAFKISNYIYPIIFIGFMLNFVCKKEKIRNIGMVIFSFGLLFEGIEVMGGVMKPLAGSPIFVDLMGKVSHMPVLGVVLGAIMTLVVQSSSATIAVLQNFASQPAADNVSSVMGLSGAIPILLGDNIGTTITALLASIGQSKNAKRTAVAHSVFNISGSVVCLFLIPVLSWFVRFISPKGNEIDVISRQIANAHTTFNIVCTLLWLPLIPLMVKIVTTLVRGKDTTEAMLYEPKFLDETMIAKPAAAMYLVTKEMERLSDIISDMLSYMKHTLIGRERQKALSDFQMNQSAAKKLQNSIANYITKMFSSGSLTENQAEKTAGLLFVSNHMERIADQCKEIGNAIDSVQREGKKFCKEDTWEIQECIEISQDLFKTSMDSVKNGNIDVANKVTKNKNKLRKVQREHNKAHLRRVKKKIADVSMTSKFSEILYGLERVADNCEGIAEEAMDNISFVDLYVEGLEQDITGGSE